MNARAPHGRTRFLRQRAPDREPVTARIKKGQMVQSYFALFNLEPRFALQAVELDAAYRELAARVHPDRYARADVAERREALALAAHVNDAYRTLRKPVLRARHLLDLRGAHGNEHDVAIPQAFLIEQMEWRETLGDARAARDGEALLRLAAVVRSRAAALQAQLEAQLDAARDDSGAVESVHQLMFMEKLAAAIDEACGLLED